VVVSLQIFNSFESTSMFLSLFVVEPPLSTIVAVALDGDTGPDLRVREERVLQCITLVKGGPEHSKRSESVRKTYVMRVLSTVIRRYDLVLTGRIVSVANR